ncbi:MAG: hypothetical protein Q8Q20_05145, partial [bacterium]|nr:hypothetical protein [bacterium]
MEENPRQRKTRKGVKFLLVGILASIVFTSFVGVFMLFVPTGKAILPFPIPVPTFQVESQPALRERIWETVKDILASSAAVAYKKGLSYFLNKAAYDAAVYIGSGGEGQTPLFLVKPGKYFEEVADGAAGEFLDTIGKSVFGESLCTFTPEVELKIQVLARRTLEPAKPSCTLKDIRNNINRISKFTTEDIASFNTSFKPWGSQIGALLTLQTSAGEAALRARNQAELEQTASSFLGVKDPVTGFVKSPREAVESTLDSVLADSRQAELTYTGKPLADAFGIFTNTLVSQLYKTIFEKGLAPPTSRYTIPGAPTGVAAAKRFNTELGRPSFRTGGAVNILNELASCPDQFRDVNNCVIRDDFESAINARMTLGEALEQGVINRNKTFGFDATGQEPEPENGLPYRSIVILRKYRIVPSTWEAAALYIKNFHDSSMGIGDLVDAYDNEFNADGTPNPFYHLVDPNWVLKAPETFCRIEGPGEEIISEQFIQSDTNGDGAIDSDDEDTRIVVRRDYCADERTCISENEDGSCSFYGYCVEEKPTWRFFGSSCSPDASSCQTFVTRGDDAVSYIQNSVNYDSCSSDSVGCRWYCQEYDAGLGEFTCSSENYLASGNKINLDADATTCPGGDASCDEYVRVMPGSNLVANSGFEIYSGILDDGNGDDISAAYPHWSWINNGLFLQAVSLPYEGAVALLAEDVGGNMEYWIETGSSVVKKTFTASAYVRTDNPADCAPIAIGVGADHDGDGSFDNYVDPIAFPATSLTNSDWTRISAAATINDFPTANENRVGFQLNVPGGCDLLIDGVQLEIGDITQYAEYNSRNQFFMTDQSDNFLSNGSFSHDNGTDFYPNFNQDDYSPGNGRADGWVATVIDDTGGYTDGSAGRGGYQDIPVTLGTRYDVYGWVVTGGNTAPITTQCLDANHLPLANCNLNADGADPRTQIVGDTGSWTWVNFGVEADSADAAFIRVRLEIDGGVKYDDLGLSLSSETSVCRADEVGCELYDPAEAGDTVPGIVGADDFCSEEYAGCKSYKQMPVENGADLLLVDRSGPDPVNLIASSGEQCNAAYVGCEEFTNLDEVELGGEGLEYYTYIRQCLKPGPECATYFRWEGDDVRGFELVSESLKGGGGTQPELADGTPCDCDPSEPGCLLYYDQGGNNYYCPEKKTISCSDDCHPLRNTLDGQIYNAIPDQSVSCPSRQATCREYRGSTGYNIRRIIEETFDDGDAVGWEPAPDVTISTESLDPGGLSALVQGGNLLYTPVNELAEEGRSYVLEFWAKSLSGNVTISANFDPSGVLFAGAAELTEDRWNKYVLGPAQFDAIVDEANEVLAISGSGAFFIDNINVWETQDSVYLKYNSYDTCPLEEVGCSLYFDRAGEENYLKSFSRLCRPEKIGCEAVIETQNSTNPFATDVRGAGTIADAVRPIINDPRDYCAESSKGCSALGLPILDDEGRAVDFETVFINDNPDTYQTSVCEDSKLYCDQYQYGEGGASFSFFKDPNAQDCEFRKGVNVAGNVYDAWFKTGTDSFCPVEKYNCIGGATPGAVCFGPGDPVCGAGSCEEYQAHPQPTTVCGPQQQEFCQGGYRADATCNSLANAEDPVLGCADPDSDDDGFCSDLTEVCYGGPRTGQSCDSDANPEDASLGCADPDSDNDGYCAEQVCQSANYCDNDPSVACFADSDCPTGGSCLNDECGGNLLCGEYWVGSCDETESGCSEYRDPQDPLPSLVSSGKICAGGANSGAACAADSDCDSGQCVYQGCRADCRVEYDSNGNFYRLNEDCEPFAHFSLAPDLLPGCEPYFNIQDTVDQST